MARRNRKKNDQGVTPAKLVLVAVLGVIFIGVLASNFMGGGESAPAPEIRKRRPLRSAPAKNPAEQQDEQENVPEQAIAEWPEMDMETVVGHNPFRLPDSLRPVGTGEPDAAELAAIQERIEQTRNAEAAKQVLEQERLRQEYELQQQELQRQEMQRKRLAVLQQLMAQGIVISIRSGKSAVVQIGERQFAVGDEIGGFRIEKINQDGSVVIEAIE